MSCMAYAVSNGTPAPSAIPLVSSNSSGVKRFMACSNAVSATNLAIAARPVLPSGSRNSPIRRS